MPLPHEPIGYWYQQRWNVVWSTNALVHALATFMPRCPEWAPIILLANSQLITVRKRK